MNLDITQLAMIISGLIAYIALASMYEEGRKLKHSLRNSKLRRRDKS